MARRRRHHIAMAAAQPTTCFHQRSEGRRSTASRSAVRSPYITFVVGRSTSEPTAVVTISIVCSSPGVGRDVAMLSSPPSTRTCDRSAGKPHTRYPRISDRRKPTTPTTMHGLPHWLVTRSSWIAIGSRTPSIARDSIEKHRSPNVDPSRSIASSIDQPTRDATRKQAPCRRVSRRRERGVGGCVSASGVSIGPFWQAPSRFSPVVPLDELEPLPRAANDPTGVFLGRAHVTRSILAANPMNIQTATRAMATNDRIAVGRRRQNNAGTISAQARKQ